MSYGCTPFFPKHFFVAKIKDDDDNDDDSGGGGGGGDSYVCVHLLWGVFQSRII